MITTEERRRRALRAIDDVVGGIVADNAETETVDFKLEAGTIDRQGDRVEVEPQHAPAAAALAVEAACMANTPDGGVLVVGVHDKLAGTEAVYGARLDADWLRRRIYALTQPSLTVDVEEIERAGKRLLLVIVPDALEEVRCGGKLRTRVGTDCEELTGDRARVFLEARRGFDWSAQPSELRLSDVDPSALGAARRYYAAERDTAPGSDRELVRRLGVIIDDSEADPQLSRAGALLMCGYEPSIPQLQLLIADAEGAASRRRIGPVAAPVLTTFDEVMGILLNEIFPPERRVIGTQAVTFRAIPETVIREALVNAIMHRDYRLDRSIIVALALGNPADTFKVRSPGGLPPGVTADRLISTPSRPRNPALAEAVRILGLAEREGVGIDTMYRLMLRDGHPEPEITDRDGEVVVRLSGGRLDGQVRALFDEIASRRPALGEEVRVAIAITELLSRPVLRADALALASQASVADALDTLHRLAEVGVVEQLLDGSRAYRLTDEARTTLSSRIRYKTRSAMSRHAELIDAYLDANADIGALEAAELLGVKRVRASQVLKQLVDRERLRPTRVTTRGPGLRYRRT